ncbi:MAG: LLM class flavin-dependent oxidoreductase [Chelatococcus sp.]|uniref:LLM class flavin-dependent oxidoreductase n=1 Tax=Chelatococcus sp. TaxID=1953771 RepID=UPI00260AF2F5|nr:LLM class flavin-dependent oxidoreductase [Chelatococcus sp.]MCO5077778.1 LLM class flavin-dependent oxidoreductase [Chelatococcus sp.]
MRLGFWTPLPHIVQSEPAIEAAVQAASKRGLGQTDELLSFTRQAVKEAEAYGFDVTLVAERWLGPDHASWILATALACATSRMEIMVATHPGILAPQAVAKMGATLDRISGGRFSMNIVNGWWPEELNVFGNGAWLEDPGQRYKRMDEFVRAIRALWTEEAPLLQGEYFTLDGTELPLKPVRSPSPPIYAASRSEPGKNTIAEFCDCWFVEYDTDFRKYEGNLGKIRVDIAEMRDRAAKFGRTLQFGMSAHVICADDATDAVRQAVELEEYGARNRVALTSAKALGAGLLGTAETVAERIDTYAEIGIDLIMLRFHPTLDGLRRFGTEVMPKVRSLNRVPVDAVV